MQQRFVYYQSVNAGWDPDEAVSRIAAAIGERARARMLYALLDGHARTSTELAAVAAVSPSTASVHLSRLKQEHLVKVLIQGKHHYFSLVGPHVARALEGLSVLAGSPRREFVPNTPKRLRSARTCYDHIAGRLGVALSDRILEMRWLANDVLAQPDGYAVTREGESAFAALGIDVTAVRALRRRFAYACLDWSERRPHIGGALGSALLRTALARKWVVQDLDGRGLEVTRHGRREIALKFGLSF